MANIDQIVKNYLSNNLAYPIVQDLAATNTPTPYIHFTWQQIPEAHHNEDGCVEYVNYRYNVVITIVMDTAAPTDPTDIFKKVRSLMHGKTYPPTGPGINKTMVTNTERPPKNTDFNKHYQGIACNVFVNEKIPII